MYTITFKNLVLYYNSNVKKYFIYLAMLYLSYIHNQQTNHLHQILIKSIQSTSPLNSPL